MTMTRAIPTGGQTGPAMFDCETAALIRTAIRPLFAKAQSWADLVEMMRQRGYSLAFRHGTFCVIEADSGKRLYGLRFLGLTMEELVCKLGRPCVLAHPGDAAHGEVLPNPPRSDQAH